MHVVVSKKDLQRTLERCQGVADKKSTMPVLGNVLLEASASELRLAATDLYLAVSGSIPAEVERPGSFAVGARDLLDRVKFMPEGGQISIVISEGAVAAIRSVGSARRYTLHGIPGTEFPSLPEPDPSVRALGLSVDALAGLIATTHFSISPDESRLHLNSALFEWEGDRVRMVTTDGHRLSKREISTKIRETASSMLIPLKGIQELRRLCHEARTDPSRGDDNDPPMLEMLQSGPNAFFRLAGFQFSVKLVDAQFPPYHQVIPASSDRLIRAPRLALYDALKAVSVAASDRTGGVKLTLNNGKLRVESESPDSGQGFDELPVEYDGPELTIGFNARYFLDVLSAIEDEEVVVGLSGELDPAVIKPGTESPEESFLAVIMPMRI
jgi:DNA polymerase-3 subunit beta